mmetsp:Transcript_55535/g.162299  ORF Transcript_55535/g.162299 Transcript_55535/m.162299 type:complete len:236 (-) Transcript_55535:646-1353(-)
MPDGERPAHCLAHLQRDRRAVGRVAVAEVEAAEHREHSPRHVVKEHLLAVHNLRFSLLWSKELNHQGRHHVDGDNQNDHCTAQGLEQAHDAVQHQLHLPEEGHPDHAQQPAQAEEPQHHERRRVEAPRGDDGNRHDEVAHAQGHYAEVEDVPEPVRAAEVLAQPEAVHLQEGLQQEDHREDDVQHLRGAPLLSLLRGKDAHADGVGRDDDVHENVQALVKLALLVVLLQIVHSHR